MTKEKIEQKLQEMNNKKDNFLPLAAINILIKYDNPDKDGYMAKIDFCCMLIESVWHNEETRDFCSEKNVNRILEYQKEHGEIYDFC